MEKQKLIYVESKALFSPSEVSDKAIVFIEDTKEIWTHGVYFSCSGTWASPITLSLTGDTTGSVSIDGSGNASIATTTNYLSGPNSLNDCNNASTTNPGKLTYYPTVLNSATNKFPTTNNANGILSLNVHDYSYTHLLGFSSDGNIYHRRRNAGTWETSWVTILNSGNYTNFHHTFASLTNKPTTLSGYGITDCIPIINGGIVTTDTDLSTLGMTTSGAKFSISRTTDTEVPSWLTSYSNLLVFRSTGDTYSGIATYTFGEYVTFLGGRNVETAPNNVPNWWFRIKGNSGTTYDLNSILTTINNLGSTYLPLTGGTLTDTLILKAGAFTASTSNSYSGGRYQAVAKPNIRLIGDSTYGLSTIEFISLKGDTSINKPSDSGFIQFQPYGVSALSSVGSHPTLKTSGETNALVLGVTNDADDIIVLQSPNVSGLRHACGTTEYYLPHVTTSTTTANKPLVSTTTAHVYTLGAECLPLSGGTMTGALNFANNTWNKVGDDAYMGDCNVAGMIGIRGFTANTPGFAMYDSVGLLGKLYASGSDLYWSNAKILTSSNYANYTTEAYLAWGGQNLASNSSPIDAVLEPSLGANRLAFLNPDAINIEYSQDGGTTWLNYNATDAQKVSLFCGGGNYSNFYLGGNSSTDPSIDRTPWRLRITISVIGYSLYCQFIKFLIYTTDVGNTTYCLLLGRKYSDYQNNVDTWVTFLTARIAGWSGWNTINHPNGITLPHTANYAQLRFEFYMTSLGTTGRASIISRIEGFAHKCWSWPSNLAGYGNIYSYDWQLNVTFPAQVTATGGFSGNLTGNVTGNVTGNADTASNISTVNPILALPFEKNTIQVVSNPLGALAELLGTAAAITHALRFNWYDTAYEIGNVRGGASNSLGFGVTYGNNNLCLLVKTNGTYSPYGFIGDLTGNAASANKWATARTITLTGDVTGSVSLDGSSNVTLTTTTSGTGTTSFLKCPDKRNSYPALIVTSGGNIGAAFISTSTLGLSEGYYCDTLILRGYATHTAGYENALFFNKQNSSVYHSQYAFGSTTTWGTMHKFLDSNNYSSYALPLSGGTMTGKLTMLANSLANLPLIYRTDGAYLSGIRFLNTLGYLGAIGMNAVNGSLYFIDTASTTYTILDSRNYTNYTINNTKSGINNTGFVGVVNGNNLYHHSELSFARFAPTDATPSYELIAELINYGTGVNTGYINYGISGFMWSYRGGNCNNSSAYPITAIVSVGPYTNSRIRVPVTTNVLVPFIVKYNNKYYLALRQLSSSTSFYFMGQKLNLLTTTIKVTDASLIEEIQGPEVETSTASKFYNNGNPQTYLHAGNYNNYALPLTGGTLTGKLTMLASSMNTLPTIHRNHVSYISGIRLENDSGYLGTIGMNAVNGSLYIMGTNETLYPVLDSRNYNNYAAAKSHTHPWSNITSVPGLLGSISTPIFYPYANDIKLGAYISTINNRFYSADLRYTVTTTGFASGDVHYLFDDNYDSRMQINMGTTATITIEGYNFVYNNGYIILYFYLYSAYPLLFPKSITAVATRLDGTTYTLNRATSVESGNTIAFLIGLEYLTKLEFTIVSLDNAYCGITNIDYYSRRTENTVRDCAVVTKYNANTLYHNLTAPKYIVTGGTSSQFLKADGSLDSTSYLPTAGGTLGSSTASFTDLFIKSSTAKLRLTSFTDSTTYIQSGNSDFSGNATLKITGYNSNTGSNLYLNFANIYCRGNNYTNIDSGNYSSYALPLSGGTLTGTLISRNIRPSANVSYSLGTSSYYYNYVYAKYFKKNGSSDSYVLLGGGGHKAVSEFAPNNVATLSSSGMGNSDLWTLVFEQSYPASHWYEPIAMFYVKGGSVGCGILCFYNYWNSATKLNAYEKEVWFFGAGKSETSITFGGANRDINDFLRIYIDTANFKYYIYYNRYNDRDVKILELLFFESPDPLHSSFFTNSTTVVNLPTESSTLVRVPIKTTYNHDRTIKTSKSIYASSFYENSDIRLKENVRRIDLSDLTKLVDLVQFNFKDSDTKKYGVIAQLLELVGLQNLVYENDGKKAVDYISLLVLEIQRLRNEIGELKLEINKKS